MMLSLATIFLSFLYSSFLIWCLYHWNRIADTSSETSIQKKVKVSVIVAVRNEAKKLPVLLKALVEQDYPRENFQVIVIDDHSTDNSFEVAEEYFRANKMQKAICLRSPGYSKKNALQYAIQNSEAEFIITTDADTYMGREWISSMVQAYRSKNALMVCGPVKLTGGEKYLEKLQSIEFIGLSGIGGAGISSGHLMFCNGANLAFTKKIFEEVNGYDNSISFSGDDTQLMLKIQKIYPGRIVFQRDTKAIVMTNVLVEASDLWYQRKRWASKIPNTLSVFTIAIAIIAWFTHALLLIQFFHVILTGDFILPLLAWSLKVICEVIFLKKVGKFYDERIPIWIILTAQPFYCLYIVFVGVLSPFGSYLWKGRRLMC